MSRATYAPSRHPRPVGGVVASVAPRSPADRASLVPGDVVVSVEGTDVRDVLDWQWLTDTPQVTLQVQGGDGVSRAVTLRREFGEAWGVEFAEALFDGVRTCRNRCVFCFMEQLPPGMRKELYLRDDDYRLSFLQGNFISLTNLSDRDVDRIVEQRLSPLYVSLHSTSPEVRAVLVCAKDDRALERFDQLVEGGIDLHVQIVLVPAVNDGERLEESLTWLARRDGVASVGVVPLGYTRFQSRYASSYDTVESADAVVRQVEPWQEASRRRDGVSWVYLADEFYLGAAMDLPPSAEYDGFPQYENGIGLVRSFVDEFAAVRQAVAAAAEALARAGRSAVLVTGSLAAKILRHTVVDSARTDVLRVLEVPNEFFGGNVSVAGLLTGHDLARAIERDAALHPGATYMIPDVVLNSDGVTLDDMTVSDIAGAADADVRVLSCDAAGVLEGLNTLAGSDSS